MKEILLTSVCAGLALGTACAQVVTYTFRDGAEVTSGGPTYTVGNTNDNMLNEDKPNANWGGFISNYVGKQSNTDSWRSVIRFSDLDNYISSTETVQKVTLGFVQFGANAQQAATIVDIYAITAANADWVEGTGDTGGAGVSSWNDRATSTPWAGGGGLGDDPGDGGYGPTLLGSYSFPDIAANDRVSRTIDLNSSANAVVENWIDNPSQNAGFLLRVRTEATLGQFVVLDSRNMATVNNRPGLIVETIPEPATWVLLAAGLTTLIVFRRRRSRA
jgi:hypothetical protein